MGKKLNESNVSKYQEKEFPSLYRKFLVEAYLPQEAFVNECLQRIYHSDRLKGTRLLDFGCGPTVNKIASASLRFNDIIVSEWAEANRKEVEKWLRGDKDALDWTPLLEQCAKSEGYRDAKDGVAEIERRIRKTVKNVVPCDALSNNILPDGIGEFDVIATSYCLESCCFTFNAYKEAIMKIAKYLTKGGTLIMTVALQAELYCIESNEVPVLFLTEEMIREALIEAGFLLQDWFCWKDSANYEAFIYGGTVVCFSMKQ